MFLAFLYPIFRSFLRAQKVLKYEFEVEAIIIFVNNKKRHQVVHSLYMKASYMVSYNFAHFSNILPF